MSELSRSAPMPASESSARSAPPVPVSPHERSTAVKAVAAVTGRASGPEDDGVVAVAPTIEDGPPPTIDDAAESAFLAEARERGEAVLPKPASDIEETDSKALPPLDELVQKIPAEVRDVLEDLFRAKFVTVKRFPKKAMK